MIDDKKIEAAKEEIYEDRFLLNGEEVVFDNDAKEEMFYKEDIKEAIGLGAKWGINEFLKDLWYPVSKEPEKFRKILYTGGSIDTTDTTMLITNNSWNTKVCLLEIKKWLYLDDLFPKEGDNHD